MLAQVTLLALLPTLFALPAIQKRATYQLIYAGRDNLCLSLQGGINTTPADGTPVVSLPCNQASVWDISPGSGSVVLSGTNFALDAGSSPGNNGGLKVWTSYPGLYQQTWYLTGDNRIAITGGDQCLDEGDNGVQTYQCTTGNTNQVWYTQTPTPRNDPTPISSSSAAPSPTPSQSSTTSGLAPVTTFSRRINPFGDQTKCVTVQNGYPGIGTSVAVSNCFADEDPFADLQRWVFDTDRSGQIRLFGDYSYGPLCLDAGDNLANGNEIKIWTCYDNLPQQTWLFSGSGLADTPVGQCLDVRAGSGGSQSKPYGSLQDLQTWACSLGDPQQFFGITAGFAGGPVQP